MSREDHLQLLESYGRRFTNVDEITTPEIIFEPDMAALLQRALTRGTPLSRAEVEEVWPEPWEEVVEA